MPDYLGVIRGIYPNALSTNAAVDRFLDLLHSRLGLAPPQVMSAGSLGLLTLIGPLGPD